jgi:integrase
VSDRPGAAVVLSRDERLALEHARLLEGVLVNVRAAHSDRTRDLYRREWGAFEAWCKHLDLASLPAEGETVAKYLAHLEIDLGRRPATIDLALATICARHRAAGLPNPRNSEIVRQNREGMQNRLGVKPKRVAPLVIEELRDVVAKLDLERVIGIRDRALLLVAFAAALRESELVALDVPDVEIGVDRMVVQIHRSKTDQKAAGAIVGIRAAEDPAICPLRALARWIEVAELRSGPLWRAVDRWENVSDQRLGVRAIDTIVKRSVEAADLDARLYAGHSMRAGLITSASDIGKSLDAIMRQSRHKSVDVVRTYIRRASAFQENVLEGLY